MLSKYLKIYLHQLILLKSLLQKDRSPVRNKIRFQRIWKRSITDVPFRHFNPGVIFPHIRLSFYEAKDRDRGRGHQQMQCSEILCNKLVMMAEMLCLDLLWVSGQVD
ncbi:hypothetical protein CDAR_101821 [Caerostris darwini]|uniref:Uncharacterized protein n=1 Tax=Caerostris darwini TaxID=1538125 RepID=A0AAV4S6S8_9ARAC|nr:hypothetical protein CDAR_101821 [Caerostris darwini]